METGVEDLASVLLCRGCLVEVDILNMYSFLWDGIADIFGQCTSVEILPEEKALPQQLCTECYSKCIQWATFRKVCLGVNESLVAKLMRDADVSGTDGVVGETLSLTGDTVEIERLVELTGPNVDTPAQADLTEVFEESSDGIAARSAEEPSAKRLSNVEPGNESPINTAKKPSLKIDSQSTQKSTNTTYAKSTINPEHLAKAAEVCREKPAEKPAKKLSGKTKGGKSKLPEENLSPKVVDNESTEPDAAEHHVPKKSVKKLSKRKSEKANLLPMAKNDELANKIDPLQPIVLLERLDMSIVSLNCAQGLKASSPPENSENSEDVSATLHCSYCGHECKTNPGMKRHLKWRHPGESTENAYTKKVEMSNVDRSQELKSDTENSPQPKKADGRKSMKYASTKKPESPSEKPRKRKKVLQECNINMESMLNMQIDSEAIDSPDLNHSFVDLHTVDTLKSDTKYVRHKKKETVV